MPPSGARTQWLLFATTGRAGRARRGLLRSMSSLRITATMPATPMRMDNSSKRSASPAS